MCPSARWGVSPGPPTVPPDAPFKVRPGQSTQRIFTSHLLMDLCFILLTSHIDVIRLWVRHQVDSPPSGSRHVPLDSSAEPRVHRTTMSPCPRGPMTTFYRLNGGCSLNPGLYGYQFTVMGSQTPATRFRRCSNRIRSHLWI
jgi:hypothetical protein